MQRLSRITLYMLAAASTAACDTTPTALRADQVPADASQIPSERVLRESLSPFRSYSGLTERERLVIRDPAAWAEAWARITARVSPPTPVPAVDFSREMVVLVAMGQQGTGGYSITIDGVFEASGRLYVQLTERSPGSRCITTQALTQPIDAVRVPRRDGAVAFVERAETHECS